MVQTGIRFSRLLAFLALFIASPALAYSPPPNCANTSGALNYATATNAFSCNALQASAITGTLPIANGGTGASATMQENGIFFTGDSRAYNIYTDSLSLSENPYAPFNWANTLLGHPFVVIGDAAVSGTRTDQLFVGGSLQTGTLTNGGSTYVNGTYYNVPLTGGAGSGAKANITVSGGAVTGVAIENSVRNAGYLVGDTLSASNTNLGGTGSGFVFTVASILTQMQAALASNARNQWLQDGVNDLSQSYPTSSTSGATACANIKNWASQLIATGYRAFVVEEYGATSLTSTEIGQLAILRQCEEEYARANVGNFILVDLAPIIYSATNSSTSAIVFNANFSSDGTHLNNYGGYYAGVYVKNLLQILLPNVPTPTGVVAAYQDGSTGGPQLLTNPTFINTSTITGVTGVTGTGPTGWTWVRASGTPTATVAMQANTDSTFGAANIGDEAVVNLTCSATGDKINVNVAPSSSLWSLTGNYYGTGGFYVEAGASNFGGVDVRLDMNTNSGTQTAFGMYAGSNVASPSTGYSGRFVTPTVYAIPGSATKGYLALYYELLCTGAGSAVVHLRPAGVWTVI